MIAGILPPMQKIFKIENSALPAIFSLSVDLSLFIFSCCVAYILFKNFNESLIQQFPCRRQLLNCENFLNEIIIFYSESEKSRRERIL